MESKSAVNGWDRILPFYIGWEGRPVPKWVETVDPPEVPLVFTGVVLVTKDGSNINVRPFFHQQSLMHVEGTWENVHIRGNPTVPGGSVLMNGTPIVPSWATMLVPILIIVAVAFAMKK